LILKQRNLGARFAFSLDEGGDLMMISLNEEFSKVELGEPAHFRNLTLFPLLRQNPAVLKPDYLLLEEAIERGTVRVTELNGGGSVPELRFENKGEEPVLLLDGEELIGAKQNRVLNLTILAAAKQTVVIPVSCVEAGRWHMEAPEFRAAPHVMYSQARAARAAHVTESMQSTGTRRSNQSAVWADIAEKAFRMKAGSPTQAMSAMYERHAISVEEHVRAFAWQERQAGVVFAIGGNPLGLDLLDHPAAMRRLFPKLVRSYALDALDAPREKTEAARREAASELLARVAQTQSFGQPALGLGKDIRLTSPSISGAALWAEDRYIHICAFSANGRAGETGFRTRLSRPTQRR
jgi:hypothetical protein